MKDFVKIIKSQETGFCKIFANYDKPSKKCYNNIPYFFSLWLQAFLKVIIFFYRTIVSVSKVKSIIWSR